MRVVVNSARISHWRTVAGVARSGSNRPGGAHARRARRTHGTHARTHARAHGRTHGRTQSLAPYITYPITNKSTRSFQGMLPADRSEDFMGASVRSVRSDWRARVDGTLYDAWRACPGFEPPRQGPPSAAAPLSLSEVPLLSNADLRAGITARTLGGRGVGTGSAGSRGSHAVDGRTRTCARARLYRVSTLRNPMARGLCLGPDMRPGT